MYPALVLALTLHVLMQPVAPATAREGRVLLDATIWVMPDEVYRVCLDVPVRHDGGHGASRPGGWGGRERGHRRPDSTISQSSRCPRHHPGRIGAWSGQGRAGHRRLALPDAEPPAALTTRRASASPRPARGPEDHRRTVVTAPAPAGGRGIQGRDDCASRRGQADGGQVHLDAQGAGHLVSHSVSLSIEAQPGRHRPSRARGQ